MGKNATYTQCTMRRSTASGSSVMTSFLPRRFAKLGAVLKLKALDDSWVDGWVVEQVGGSAVDSSDLPDFRKAVRNHRKLTGDSTRRSKN